MSRHHRQLEQQQLRVSFWRQQNRHHRQLEQQQLRVSFWRQQNRRCQPDHPRGASGGDVLGLLTLVLHAATPVEELTSMIYTCPTFHHGIDDALRNVT